MDFARDYRYSALPPGMAQPPGAQRAERLLQGAGLGSGDSQGGDPFTPDGGALPQGALQPASPTIPAEQGDPDGASVIGSEAARVLPGIKLTLVQRGRLVGLHRRTGESLAPPPPARGPQGPVERRDPQRPAPTKRTKLSALVDPTAEAEVIPLERLAVRQYFLRYKETHGGRPGCRGRTHV